MNVPAFSVRYRIKIESLVLINYTLDILRIIPSYSQLYGGIKHVTCENWFHFH